MLTNNAIIQAGQKIGEVKEITDTRDTLQKFRRLGLYYLLRANGFTGEDMNESTPYEEMLAFAKAHEKRLDFSKVEISHGEYWGYIVAKPKSVIEEERTIDTKIQGQRKEYKDFEWQELRSEAKKVGINIHKMKKDEVIASLVDHKNAA